MILNHNEDLVNLLRSITSPIIFFLPFFIDLGYSWIFLYFVAAFLLIGDMNYILHLHVHNPFTTYRWLNNLVDLCLGSVTGMTASNWRIQHVYGHHAGDDDAFVVSLKRAHRYSIRDALRFSTLSILPTYWMPIWISFQKGVLAKEKRPINYRSAFTEQLGQIAFILCLTFYNLTLTLFYVLPWYLLVYFISRYVDYLNHYGCGDQKFDVSNNCLEERFNANMHNFGFHTAHHLYAAAHWTELPKIHEKIKDKIPQERQKTFSWSFLQFPYHLILALKREM